MVVWIEDVILDNMIIDTLILLSVKNIAKLQTKNWRITTSALFGTIIAIISLLLPSFINLLIKPFVAAIMTFFAFGISTWKKFFITYFLFFLTTFVFGGASIAICEMFGIQYKISSSISYQNNFPISIVMLVCVFVYFCLKNIIKFSFSRHKTDCLKYKVTIQNDNKIIDISAFLDTGNCLSHNNMPITIINYQTFCKLFPKVILEDILFRILSR